MTPSPAPVDRRPIPRQEWLWLAGAILLGAIVRLSVPGRMAVEHFDEGVYASNFWFGVEAGYEYPARHLYAPPLLPAVIEWTMIAATICGIRPTGFIPILPSLIAGLVTIPSIWWIGRRWFGPTAGIVSAWLVVASDFHASYSRAALTDVPVCLFILWGVYFLWQAIQSGSRRDVLLAGLFTSLAWWTKYNGWLPLAIGLAGGIAWQLALPRAERQLAAVGKRWLMVAGLVFVLWSPVLIGLQKHGGYSTVAANHRKYIGGVHNWRFAAVRQLTQISLYDNWFGVIYEAYSASLAARKEPHKPATTPSAETTPSANPPGNRLEPGRGDVPQTDANQMSANAHRPVIRAVSAWGLAVATPVVLLVCVGASVTAMFSRGLLPTSGAWMVFAWICGLSLVTPLYHPYPRLVLPWLIAVWLGAGLAAEWLAGSGRLSGTAPEAGELRRKARWIEVGIASWLVLVTIVRCSIGTELAWHDRSELFRAAESFASQIREQTSSSGYPAEEAIVYVFGEPAIVFALKASGLSLVGPVQDLGFLSRPQARPTFLIHSDRGLRDAAFRADWNVHRNDFETLRTLAIHESTLVLLDQPEELARLDERQRIGESLSLLRVR